MFVALILTVCLYTNTAQCEDKEFLFESSGSLFACLYQAPPFIADWSQTHPKWHVTRWRCSTPGALGKGI